MHVRTYRICRLVHYLRMLTTRLATGLSAQD